MTRSRTTAAIVAAAALLAACNRPDELPDMALTQYSVTFEAKGPSGDPNAATLHAINTGGGSLAEPTAGIAYHHGSGWLEAFVGGGGGGPWTIVLQPHTAALQPGTYRAAVTVTSASPSARRAQVDVTLTVPGPSYVVSAASLAFEAPAAGDPAPLTFEVTNGGRGALPVPDLEVQYAGSTGWLTAAVNGTSAGYTVTVAAHEIPAMPSGIHAATLSLGSAVLGGVRRPVDVTFALRPQLVLSGALAPFVPAAGDTRPLTQTFTVRNIGRGVLPAPTASTVTRSGRWLSATVSGSAEPYTVVATVDGYRALGEGDYQGTLSLLAPAATTQPPVPVTLRVGPPAMGVSGGVSWSAIGGCPLPYRESVVVSNTGVGLLSRPTVTIPADAASWLLAEVFGEVAPYGVAFTVVAPPPVAPGQSLQVTAELRATGIAEAAQVPVSFALQAPAITGTRAAPSPVVIRAQAGTGDPPPAYLTVWTDGGCIPAPTLTYAYDPGDTGWLSWREITGPQRHHLLLQATTAGMAPGAARRLSLAVTSLRPGENTPVFATTVPLTLENAVVEPTGALSTARREHAAVALHDGSALVIGGAADTGAIPIGPDARILASVERYDPARGQFEAYPPLLEARSGHGAVALYDGRVAVCGGWSGSAYLRTCEVGSPGGWTTLATLRRAPPSPTLVVAGRKLVVVGRAGAYAEEDDDVEVVDVDTGVVRFATDGASERVRGTVAVAALDGTVLVVGAAGGVAWRYDIATETWARTGSMAVARFAPALAPLPDGRVLAVDGLGTDPSDAASRAERGAEVWDRTTGTWSRAAGAKYKHVPGDLVLLVNGKVVAVNGERVLGDATGEIELFDPATATWSIVPGSSVPAPVLGARVVRLVDGRLLLIGGMRSYGAAVAEVLTW